MNRFLFGITWAARENWLLAPIVLGMICLMLWRFRRVHAGLKRLASSALMSNVVQHYALSTQVFKIVLRSIGLVALFLALLRPQWDTKKELVAQEGRDVMIALDVSRSMLASDIKPSRLERAKEKITVLVQKLSAERVGLILFAGSAFVQCPLTADHSAFSLFLRQIDADTISSSTTAVEQALQKALDSFAQAPSRKNKLLVLFTDGEDFSTNLASIKQQAAQQELRIFTIGVGTAQGAPVPLFDEQGKQTGHQRDKDDKVVMSRLDEKLLHELAQETGGQYVRMTNDATDIEQVTSLVQQFEKEHLGDKQLARRHEQYHYFVAVSFVCFALEWLL